MKRFLALVILLAGTSAWAAGSSGSSDKQYNIRLDPLSLILHQVRADFDIKVDPNWTVGPSVIFWHYNLGRDSYSTGDYTVDAFGLGARANWFKEGVYQTGLYVGPSLNYVNVKVKTTDVLGGEATGSGSGLYATGLVGYGWFWDNFNILLGGGLAVGLGNFDVTVSDSAGSRKVSTNLGTGLALEFSLGYAF